MANVSFDLWVADDAASAEVRLVADACVSLSADAGIAELVDAAVAAVAEAKARAAGIPPTADEGHPSLPEAAGSAALSRSNVRVWVRAVASQEWQLASSTAGAGRVRDLLPADIADELAGLRDQEKPFDSVRAKPSVLSRVFWSRISCGCRVNSYFWAVRNSLATTSAIEISANGRVKYGSQTDRTAASSSSRRRWPGIQPACTCSLAILR